MPSTDRKLLSMACVLLLCFSTFFTSAVAQAVAADAPAVAPAVAAESPTDELAPAMKVASPELQEKVEAQTGGEVVTEREAELLERLPDMTIDEEGMLANSRLLRVIVYTAVAGMAFFVPVFIVHLIGKFFYTKVSAKAGGGVPPGLKKGVELEKKLKSATSENEQLKQLLDV
eukprot:7514379-Pyramimonas_sp.AAC.2